MLRRAFLNGVLLAGAIGLTGPTAIAQDIPDRTIRIGFAAHSIELGALFGQLREGFRAHLDAAGVKYEFFEAAPDASSNHAAMLRILEDMAALGPRLPPRRADLPPAQRTRPRGSRHGRHEAPHDGLHAPGRGGSRTTTRY